MKYGIPFPMCFNCQNGQKSEKDSSLFTAEIPGGSHAVLHSRGHLFVDLSGPVNEVCAGKLSMIKAWEALKHPEANTYMSR